MKKWLLYSSGVLLLIALAGGYITYNSILLAEVYGEDITRWQTVESSWELMTPLAEKEKEKAIDMLVQDVIDKRVFWEILEEVPVELIKEVTGKDIGDTIAVDDERVKDHIKAAKRSTERAKRKLQEGEYDTEQYQKIKRVNQKRIKEKKRKLSSDTSRKFKNEKDLRGFLVGEIMKGEPVLYDFLAKYYEVERSNPEEAVYKMIREGINRNKIKIYNEKVRQRLEEKMKKDELISYRSIFSNRKVKPVNSEHK